MKQWLCFTIVVLCLVSFGCSGFSGNTQADNAALLTAIELGGYNLGYYVGKSKTDSDDIAIADAYKLARTGSLSPAEVAAAFSKFKIENPQLAGSLMIVLTNMGATTDPTTGGLISLSNIPVEYWDRAARGYASGYEFGRLGQKSTKVSAVVAIMPKK
jgi:hypothetical protein